MQQLITAPNPQPIFTPLQAALQMATAHYAVGPYLYLVRHLIVSGRENVPKNTPLIVVSNHLSYFDPPIACVATDVHMCFMAKKELFQNPWLAKLITFYGAISINRDKPSLSSIKLIKKAIQSGWSVSIFIEGTRSKIEGTLNTPHTGPAYFAMANQVPILPVGLIDTNKEKKKCYAKIGR